MYKKSYRGLLDDDGCVIVFCVIGYRFENYLIVIYCDGVKLGGLQFVNVIRKDEDLE